LSSPTIPKQTDYDKFKTNGNVLVYQSYGDTLHKVILFGIKSESEFNSLFES
jgi:hypothetical protein